MNQTLSRRKKTAAVICAIMFACLIMILQVKPVSAADTEGYELSKYDMTAVINKNHSYAITEKLTVDLPENFDSFTVSIPTGNYRVSDVRAGDAAFTTSTEENHMNVTITSRSMLKKGLHTFKISYTIEEYAENNEKNDIFYFDALPPSWKIPINEVKITLVFPKDFQWGDLQYYAGQFGSQDVNDKLSVTTSKNMVIMTGTKLPANYGITFKAQLKNGYWQGALDNNWASVLAVTVMLFALVIILLLWLIGGRDPRFRHRKVVYPVEGVTPFEVGYLFTGKIRSKDIVSMILYLAINGSLRISEYAPKKYRLYKLDEPKEEERYIRSVYHTLFDDVYEGRAIEMEELGRKLLTVRENVKASVESGYSSKDMRAATKLSKVLRWVSSIMLSVCIGIIPLLTQIYEYQEMTYGIPVAVFIISLASIFATTKCYDLKYDMSRTRYNFSFGLAAAAFLTVLAYAAITLGFACRVPLIPLAIAACGIVSMMFICLMKARGYSNAKIVNQLLALRHFINNAGSAEIAVLCAHDPDYYYKTLPYAFIFSMMEKWSKKFRWMQIKEPDWFSDDISGHAITNAMRPRSTVDYANEINTFARTIISEHRARRSRGRRHT